MRSLVLLPLVSLLGACSVLDSLNFGGATLNPNKVYLNRADVITVSARETDRYACYGRPLFCVQRGMSFECRCP